METSSNAKRLKQKPHQCNLSESYNIEASHSLLNHNDVDVKKNLGRNQDVYFTEHAANIISFSSENFYTRVHISMRFQ